jgi:cytochrome b involved in lipid metabolism
MGKGGESVKATNSPPFEAPATPATREKRGGKRLIVLIDGQHYDVTDFRHPGGSIIRFLATEGDAQNVDATNAFREFHSRSSKATKILKSMPKVDRITARTEESARHDALTKDFVALRTELVAEGLFKPSLVHVVFRFVEIVVLFAASFWLLSQQNSLAGFMGAVVNGIAQGRCGWLMHEGGHNSLTGRIKVDIRLQEVVYGLGCGMSGAWWRNQHNKHHATPQKLKHDVDLDTLPLVAFNDRIAAKVKRHSLLARWLSFQSYLFATVSCLLVGLFWTLYLHPRHIVRTRRIIEAVCCAARYVVWFALLYNFGYSTLGATGLYLGCFGAGCTYIFVNFAVSHTHLPVTDADVYLHWIEYGALHTTNVSTNSWCARTAPRSASRSTVRSQVCDLVDELPQLPNRAPSVPFHAAVSAPSHLPKGQAAVREARSSVRQPPLHAGAMGHLC